MEETTVIASLPNLEIRVARRDLPDEGAEVIGIQIKATPSFEAVADGMRRGLSLNPWLAPMQLWATAAQAFWGPWLAGPGALAMSRLGKTNGGQKP